MYEMVWCLIFLIIFSDTFIHNSKANNKYANFQSRLVRAVIEISYSIKTSRDFLKQLFRALIQITGIRAPEIAVSILSLTSVAK